MWRRIATASRERNSLVRASLSNTDTIYSTDLSSSSSSSNSSGRSILRTKRFRHDVALQLDYYMSSQFAGVANAIVHGLYDGAGIDLTVLPTCPVGHEQDRTRQRQTDRPNDVALGSVEQNVFVPTLLARPLELRTTAVAAMFRRSPLALATFRTDVADVGTIGAHEDTVELVRRLFPHARVVASPRATKVADLTNGTYDAVQVYTTTEIPTLEVMSDETGGSAVNAIELEGLNDARLGYSQVLFAADECLKDDRRQVVQAFLEATFAGWQMSIRNDAADTLDAVKEARAKLGLDDEGNDHWHDRTAEEMLRRINDHVKETFQGDRYGVIDERRWDEANRWLAGEGPGATTTTTKIGLGFSLDGAIWQPPDQMLAGNELGRRILQDARASAGLFHRTYNRKPSLAVVTVGTLDRYRHADRRLELYSNTSNSWFSKAETGRANGFDVAEIDLPADGTTTDALLSQLYALSDRYDGIQLMWPLPPQIDTSRVYSAIDVSKDVDGIHYVGQVEIGSGDGAYPPVTPAAVMDLIEEHGIDVVGKRALVIGRSPIVGSPVAHMLRSADAVVTVAHSGTDRAVLKDLVQTSDLIVACAGSPGLIPADWIQGAVVVNVGTTFAEDADELVSDVEGDIASHASLYSPVPGGIGPLSLPCLLRNVARAAWDRRDRGGTKDDGWSRTSARLVKTYHFDTYASAIDFATRLDEASTMMDHHANMSFTHRCVDGVDVRLEYFTYEASELTEKDYQAAKVADSIFEGKEVIIPASN